MSIEGERMRKLIITLLSIGLLSNSIVAISPLRVYKCRPSNPSADCSQGELDSARNWFKNAKIGALTTFVTLLAAFGIAVTVYQLQQEQVEAVAPVSFERVERKPEPSSAPISSTGAELRETVREMERKEKEEKARIGNIKNKLGEIAKKLQSPGLTADERQRLVQEQRQLLKDIYTH